MLSKDIYKGVRKDFDTFAIAQGSLPDTKCFLKVVGKSWSALMRKETL